MGDGIDLFGQIAVRNQFLTEAQLVEALTYQEDEDPYKALGQILQEAGRISPLQIDACLAVQAALRDTSGESETDPFNAAQRYGKKILKAGISTKEQLVECLKVIRRAIRHGADELPELDELLIARGYATEEDLDELDAEGFSSPPPVIDGYKLLEEIRSGGMGTVYKARQLALYRIVAIKVLDPRLSATATHVRRFMEEARAMGRLNHENVVGAIDAGECRGQAYCVMEFVNGETVLEAVTRDGPYKTERALEITYETARALAHVHSHRIIHRDVKPSNILINHREEAKLCDLGFAKIDGKDPMMGVAGTTLGTPYYMSPEQARGAPDIDERTDIYSLGASLYQMVTGRVPFRGTSAMEIMKRHLTDPVRYTSKERETLDDRLRAIIVKMMSKKREDRPQTAREVMEELAPFLHHTITGTDFHHGPPSAQEDLTETRA